MSAFDAWLRSIGAVVTILSVHHAEPVRDRLADTLWQKPGAHMTECRALAANPKAFASRLRPGDRLTCNVTDLERGTARRIFDGLTEEQAP